MPSHKPKAKGLEKEIEDEILSLFSGAGFNPIKKEDVLSRRTRDKKEVEKVFQHLLKRGMIVKVTEDSYLSQDMLGKAKDKLAAWITDKGKIKAAEFRDIIGCGRKFAIELLEYFDKERVTLRSGDYRILRKAVKT
ncbi:MAG: SelB C-terminal domain-containing protein [Deltaproteobacteria bacterium]|nr:SelB C-terminal domain-containing protein [Deltaproteobacteria bacterium]